MDPTRLNGVRERSRRDVGASDAFDRRVSHRGRSDFLHRARLVALEDGLSQQQAMGLLEQQDHAATAIRRGALDAEGRYAVEGLLAGGHCRTGIHRDLMLENVSRNWAEDWALSI